MQPDLTDIFQCYNEFHAAFQGDIQSLACGHICAKCESNCETEAEGDETDFKYVLGFLPYEMEYVAASLGVPPEEFKNKYTWGINTGKQVIRCMRFSGTCPFLGANYECLQGEKKIITCKIYPLIHYPLIGFSLSRHCDLVRYPEVLSKYEKGLVHYKSLLSRLPFDDEYRYMREGFDAIQLDARKARRILKSKVYVEVGMTEFRSMLLADPSLI
jgi:hypothetical protein